MYLHNSDGGLDDSCLPLCLALSDYATHEAGPVVIHIAFRSGELMIQSDQIVRAASDAESAIEFFCDPCTK